MPRAKQLKGEVNITWDAGEANPKQKLFYESRALFTAYGGAKGGGKTHAVRTKAVGGAIFNPGIHILIVRAHYPELEENHINPIKRMVPPELASYNGSNHLMQFYNGSTIKFGHWDGEDSENEYNGLEYDWIFIDEATQFSERAFNFLGGCLRGATPFPKRMYLTCNPGGIGHNWVKRLFIDRQYKTNCDNPEENEDPNDYNFIFATVEDNTHLLENSPTYLKTLANMPEDLRKAYRYGDWSAIGGSYFSEFSFKTHVVTPFRIPDHWERFRSIDYGLDMLAVFWAAVDEDGRIWIYREFEEKGLIVSAASKQILLNTLPGENIVATYAPPDLWNRQKDTGKTMAETFTKNGVPLIKSDNNRVQGHMILKELLAPIPLTDKYVRSMYGDKCPDKLPGIMFFNNVEKACVDLRDIQADDNNPNDCSKQPHEVTHTVDSLRYLCVMRYAPAEAPVQQAPVDEDEPEDYEDFMTGGAITDSYMDY